MGKGVVAFLRAALGFEQDIMRQGRPQAPTKKSLTDIPLSF